MAPQVRYLENLIASFLKPGIDVKLVYSYHSSYCNIRFHDKRANSYQLVQITDEMLHTLQGPNNVIDYLSKATGYLKIAPLYLRRFDQLMYEIQWHEFTPGKIWA